jgi:hypothetical protein
LSTGINIEGTDHGPLAQAIADQAKAAFEALAVIGAPSQTVISNNHIETKAEQESWPVDPIGHVMDQWHYVDGQWVVKKGQDASTAF